MDNLLFPCITEKQMAPVRLTMDEYNRLIEEDCANFPRTEAYYQEKKRLSVDAPFTL